MTTMSVRHGEQVGVEWTARPLRPIARWAAVADESGRPRLRMTWSVPDVSASAVTTSDGAARSDG
jgi:hypothetical protein